MLEIRPETFAVGFPLTEDGARELIDKIQNWTLLSNNGSFQADVKLFTGSKIYDAIITVWNFTHRIKIECAGQSSCLVDHDHAVFKAALAKSSIFTERKYSRVFDFESQKV